MSSLMVSVISFIAGVKDRFTSEEKGATAVEYGLLVALIAAVIVGVVFTIGGQILEGFTDVTTELTKVA
ncbi:Flp family type IVb pilin [Arthrobacter sp. D3-18]